MLLCMTACRLWCLSKSPWIISLAISPRGPRNSSKPKAWSFLVPHRMTGSQYSTTTDASSSTGWCLTSPYHLPLVPQRCRTSSPAYQCCLTTFQRCTGQVNTPFSDLVDMPAKPWALPVYLPDGLRQKWLDLLRQQGYRLQFFTTRRLQLCGPFPISFSHSIDKVRHQAWRQPRLDTKTMPSNVQCVLKLSKAFQDT